MPQPQRPQSRKSLESHGKGSSCPRLSKGVLRLYSMRFCPRSQRTRLVLEHKKIPYETVNVRLHFDEKPDWLLKKNPFGQVPVLEKDGQIIYNSTATCEWLDEVYTVHPPKLMPDNPCMKAKDRALLENLGMLSERFYRILFKPEPKVEYVGGPFSLPDTFQRLFFDPNVREHSLRVIHENLKHYEIALVERGGLFFGGLEPSMLDFYLWPDMERLPVMTSYLKVNQWDVIDKSLFPRLKAWYSAMTKVPAVKATMLDKSAHRHYLLRLAEGQPDYDYQL